MDTRERDDRKARLHLHAPVSTEGDDVVAKDCVLVRVELSCGHLGCCCHSRGIRDPLEHDSYRTAVQQIKSRTGIDVRVSTRLN